MSQIPPPIKASPISSISHSTVSLWDGDPGRLIAELRTRVRAEVRRARIAELEPRLASAEAALAQWLKIIPWSGFFPNPSRSHFEKYPETKV